MSSEEEEMYCSRCNNQTEYSLILTCDHKLCISCAAQILRNQNKINYNSSQFIKCDKCKSLTELEPQTIKQILEGGYENIEEHQFNYMNMYNNDNDLDNNDFKTNQYMNPEEANNNYINKNNNLNNEIGQNQDNKENKINNNKLNNNKNIENNISTSEINIINELNQNNIRQLCKEHSEPLTYLCLDCMSNCICTECVVHGIHKNHEVLNIKRAYPLIFKKLGDLSKYANDKKSSIILVNETIVKKKNLINNLIERCKNEIHSTFDQIKIRLDNKEKEIIDNTTSLLVKNIEELNNFENELKQNCTKLEDIIEKINNILNKKDDLNTINYFCENNNKILKQCELNDINSFPDLDNYTNIKLKPNLFTLNNLLEGINNFNFEIINLKGLETNNRNKVPKKIPKNKFKKSNYDNMNNNINQFNNMTNENLNNNIMINNMQKQNILMPFQNQFSNNKNLRNKRPRTAKPTNRKRYMTKKNTNNNMNNYPTNFNIDMNNYPININQNYEDYQNNMNPDFENIGTYEQNNYNIKGDENNF